MFDFEKLVNDIEEHPVIVAIVIFFLILIVANVFKNNAVKGSTPPTTTSTGTGDTTSETYNQTFNTYPTVPGSTSNPPAVVTPPVTTPVPVPVAMVTHLTIRQPSSADLQKGVKSIPIRSKTSTVGSQAGSINFGASIDATGIPVVGDWNYPLSGGNGSNMWYPVSNGYISAYDVATVTTTPKS